jgi:hypothetical protein
MDRVPSIGTDAFESSTNMLVGAVKLLASLARARVTKPSVNIGGRGTGQSI